jgi:hypothetical protein
MLLRTLAEYQIHHVPFLYDAKNNELGGYCLPVPRIILLNTNQYLSYKEKVLIHESLHAWDFITIGKSRTEKEIKKKTNELYLEIYGKRYCD